jgi:DnaJ-class molecular chaperone
VSDLAPTEIQALARIMNELDYYQLMHVRRGASARELKVAYYSTSRAFHPDANRHLGPELREAVATITKRVTEAYAVLRDPRRRQAYDRLLDEGSGVRMQLAEAEAAAERQALENEGRTPQGRQYFKLAKANMERQDWEAAARDLQTALTFEPDNALLRERFAEVRKKLGYKSSR